MQINFLKKTNQFKHDMQTINIRKHWTIILYVLFALILCSFVFGFYIFTKEGQDTSSDINVLTKTHNKISREKLQNILNIFSDREKKSAEILNTIPAVMDPSK